MADSFDPRVTPARPDIAAAHLKGKVEAARFVEGWSEEIAVGRVPLRAAPSEDAIQDSELLYGEQVTVYDVSQDGWAWIQASNDGYVGYVRSDSMGDVPAATERVSTLMAPAFSAPDFKSPVRDLLPMNSVVPVRSRSGDYVEIAFGHFMHSRHLTMNVESDFVAVAERFIGAPYVWGGKMAAGIDCSGLIQTGLQACGIAAQRDTDMLERTLGHKIPQYDLKRGDLTFWDGHVGVMRDAETLLHANAYHMEVFSEPLDQAISRIAKVAGPITAVKRITFSLKRQ